MSGSYVEIKVLHIQGREGFFKALLHVGVVRVPKLACKEDFFARNAAILYPLADFGLVA
jgi:hypothetical protein